MKFLTQTRVQFFICGSIFLAALTACALPKATATQTLTPSATPSPAITITATYPCPQATQELPPMVAPVISPTDEAMQKVYISGNFESALVRTESGEFYSLPERENGYLVVEISLLPDTTHHLTVTAHVPINTWDYCTYGGYDMTTTTDREGNPLTIMHGTPPTPSASTETINSRNISRIVKLADLDAKERMSGFIFAGEFELLTFGFDQPATRWLLPSLTRTGVIGTDEPMQPSPVSAAYYPVDLPEMLALGGAGNPGGKEEFSVKIYSMKEDSWKYLGKHGGSVETIEFSPSGKWLASAANDDAVQIWDVDQAKLRSIFHSGRSGVTESFYCLHWMDDSTLWAGGNQSIYQVNAVDGKLLQSIPIDGNYACDFSTDGRWFAATDQASRVRLVDLKSAQIITLEPPSDEMLYMVDTSLSPDGKLVAAMNNLGFWYVWNTDDYQLLLTQPPTLADGQYIEFSPEGYYLAVGGWKSPVVQLWGIP